MIPIILRLRKGIHKDIALVQDILIQEIYKIFNDAVLHGGTAIWRCYKGNRFSEDLDVYMKRDLEKINSFFNNLSNKGFIIEKKKISYNSLYSKLKNNRTSVRFEVLFKKIEGVLKEYETSEGNLITIYTLTPEQLINEKVDAYLKRFKIRDLYDIFFLLRHVKDKSKISLKIKRLLREFRKPIDENELKVLILEGIVPDTDKMFDYIKNY
ncbi:MAG: nucleotidyl transferase AbiEii/AbiGii toxin family protein [Nanoarchaeota archaeon]